MRKPEASAPNPNSPDYKRKDDFIARLAGTQKDSPAQDAVLGEFGAALIINNSLSITQLENLLEVLINTGLLTYRTSHKEELDKSTGWDEDWIMQSLDAAHWDIEEDGKLQAQTIAASYRLSQSSLLPERMEVVAGLFNAAQLATIEKSDARKWIPFEDPRYYASIQALEETEGHVFGFRKGLIYELRDLGLATVPDVELIESSEAQDFRALGMETQICDSLMTLHFVRGLEGTTVSEAFRGLQGVLHTGFTTGVRDAQEAGVRFRQGW